MEYEIYSYRFAKEIIQHENYSAAFDEITQIITGCPVFTWPNKSRKNPKLDVVQQLLNAYFNVEFHCQYGWEFHPSATNIPHSALKADFKKIFGDLIIHSEVQLGNMARWYSDIFKFQTAYSQGKIKMGLCIVPFNDLGRRIDSNVTHFERCVREIKSAEMSITLPILIIGIKPDANTEIIDVSISQFDTINDIIGHGNSDNLYRIINAFINNIDIQTISQISVVGDRPL